MAGKWYPPHLGEPSAQRLEDTIRVLAEDRNLQSAAPVVHKTGRSQASIGTTASKPVRNRTHPAATPDPLAPGEVLGNYRIIKLINEGGMGIVLSAMDVRDDRQVVLKVLKPDPSKQEMQMARFQYEARVMFEVQSPHIVKLFELVDLMDQVPPMAYMSMESLSGQDLRCHLVQRGALRPEVALEIASQVARGMAQVHARGMAHRDLKPSNIFLVDSQGDTALVKILDFGCAKDLASVDHELTDPGTAIGTPAYMAPEQITNLDPDARMEIYSLGVVLYQMLTGRRPHAGVTYGELIMKVITATPAAINDHLDEHDHVPQIVTSVVMKCLEKNPARRFQTMNELLRALKDAQAAIPDQRTTLVDVPAHAEGA